MQSFEPRLFLGYLLIAIPVLMTLVGMVWLPWDPNAIDLLHRSASPSTQHWLGTDHFGRDVLSRVMIGGWRSMSLGIGGPLLGLLVAIPISLAAALNRGALEQAILRLNDALLSIPTLIFTLLIIVGLGAGHGNAIIAIAISIIPKFIRIIHAAAASVVREEFVAAARIRGERLSFILFREIFPNIWAPVIVEASIFIGFSITAGAALSYLGLGTQPPAADWGVMVKEGWQIAYQTLWPVMGSALPIACAVLGINLVGDVMQDKLGIGGH